MPKNLIKGFEAFCSDEYCGKDALMPKLVKEGQNPDYFIISCIDSRANPGTIFRPAPGTFFAFKAMGAIVRPYKQGTALAASMQFAFEHMKVPNLILLGHTQCGAIKALAENIDDPEIASFIDVERKSVERAKKKLGSDGTDEQLLREAERQTVIQSMENVKSYPSVKKALVENRLNIFGWIFDMESGTLMQYNPQTDNFDPISNYTCKPGEQKNKKGSCCA